MKIIFVQLEVPGMYWELNSDVFWIQTTATKIGYYVQIEVPCMYWLLNSDVFLIQTTTTKTDFNSQYRQTFTTINNIALSHWSGLR